jgi:putative phosphoesterase
VEKEKMRIGVISDTHGSMKAIDRVVEAAGKVDLWFHAGDYSQDAPYLEEKAGVPVYTVCGNCDIYEGRGPVELVTKLEGFTIAMVHGNRYVYGSHFDRLIYWAEEKQADVVIFGHIHVPVNTETDGILVVNPGSAARPRNKVPTYGILTLLKGRKPAFEVCTIQK